MLKKEKLNNLKKEYRLYNYSLNQINDFFRTVSFPEVSRRELFNILKMLKSTGSLEDFKAGKLEDAALKLDDKTKSLVTTEMEFTKLKNATSLSKLETLRLLEVYVKVIMIEMAPDTLEKTTAKFK